MLRRNDEGKEVSRNQIMYRRVKHAKDFGIFPKSNRKLLKYFQRERDIRFAF